MYKHKELYTLDFRRVKTYLEMHFIIKKEFDWPDYYGCNWDAFWDCLTNMIGRPFHVEILGLDVIERKFEDAARNMIDLFKEFKHFNGDKYADDVQITLVDGDVRVNVD